MERLNSTKVCLLTFVFCLAAASRVHAETAQDFFKQGNAAYAEGKFSDALSLYESAQQNGLRHWILYYNLGNAYYKNGQLGKAIASYERAFRLNSGSGDVIYNLNLAAAKAGDPVLPESALPTLAWRLFYFLSLNTLTMATSMLFILLCLAVGWSLTTSSDLFLRTGPKSFRLSMESLVGLFVLLVFLGSWLGVRIYYAEQPEAVVTANVAEVRSGPNPTYPANFTVPEGRRLLVLDEQEPVTGWLEVGVPQEGLKGWVPTTSLEVL
jgi:hypothetical protein